MKAWRGLAVTSWLLFVFLCAGSEGQALPPVVLLKSFLTIGAVPERVVLHHGGRTEKPLSKKDWDRWVNVLGESLGLSHADKVVQADGVKYTAEGRFGQSMSVRLTVLDDEPDRPVSRPYFSVQVVGSGRSAGEWIRASDWLARVLRSNGLIPCFHYAIQGSKRLDSPRPDPSVAEVFRFLNAAEVEEMRAGRTVSISAFSPLLPDRMRTGNGWMNVQIAARVASDEHRLILTVGSPIITIEY
jgi:hypothetical protein